MKITFFSDTHTKHEEVDFGSGDILVCTGDFTNKGSSFDVSRFAYHIKDLPYKHKIVIAGNHDFGFEDHRKLEVEQILKDCGIIYLNDSGVTIDGVKFWGSPVQPWFYDWAFNRQRGEDIRKHWDLIPKDTDVLLTHGPPHGILDRCMDGSKVGCEELLEVVYKIKPRIHAFGHIHEGYGTKRIGKTTFINSSILDHRYIKKNEPITVEIL